ncbi:Sodium-coupled monocarboxylate transporter 2 [Armadillidium nasatum]|uniref:Sodium-coupled monocarboxylate transporter 2 n=1 Tax=Armadillidium nasatum TaxID=96803 RepID=A0A5N5SQQ5_9CRUS|nr:Sodium-coupled monocarboxylate transporter 2 [Armadillidium nasatum]
MDNEKGFSVVDNCVFAGMLIISAVIGLYISCKGSKSPEEFLMGNRSLKPLPVSLSLITSYIHAVATIGLPAEVYANGLQISTITLGCSLAIIFSSYFLLPVLYSLKLTSINEYIELRFKSKRLRFVIFLLSMAKSLAANGIGLYAPTIALSSFTNLSTLNSIFILGIICTLYSSFGGIKAVIWTDVFQFSVIMIGLITIVGVGCAQNGGLIETLHTASKGGRLEMFNMSLSPFVRHTFFNTLALGFLYQLSNYSSEQINVQRICAVKSVKNARRVLKYNNYGKFFAYVLTFSCGLVAYSTYAGCDPMTLGLIKKKDQILPYFVIDKLSFVPGLPGLFIATIIGGALRGMEIDAVCSSVTLVLDLT